MRSNRWMKRYVELYTLFLCEKVWKKKVIKKYREVYVPTIKWKRGKDNVY